MQKSKLIGNLYHLYAKKQPRGYQPFVGNIRSGINVPIKKIFRTQEGCVIFLEKHLEEIKKEYF